MYLGFVRVVRLLSVVGVVFVLLWKLLRVMYLCVTALGVLCSTM